MRERVDLFVVVGGHMGFPGGSLLKNLPANAEDARDAGSLSWEDPLEEETAPHSSILA